MTQNEAEDSRDLARVRANALLLAGRLRIEVAGVEVGHVEIPDGMEPATLTEHIRFEFPGEVR